MQSMYVFFLFKLYFQIRTPTKLWFQFGVLLTVDLQLFSSGLDTSSNLDTFFDQEIEGYLRFEFTNSLLFRFNLSAFFGLG